MSLETTDLDALEFYCRESQAQGFVHAGNPAMWLDFITELRRARKVVEAVRHAGSSWLHPKCNPADCRLAQIRVALQEHDSSGD